MTTFLISGRSGLGDDYIALRRAQHWAPLDIPGPTKIFIHREPIAIKAIVEVKKVYANGRKYTARMGEVTGICDHCQKEFVKFQRVKDPPAKNCPECAPIVRRLVAKKASLAYAANAARRRGE